MVMKAADARATRRLPSLAILTVLGLAVGVATAAVLAAGGRWVQDVSLAASDFLMISDAGPRLGMLSQPDNDVVLVHYGRGSAERLGTRPTLQTDRQVYRNLLAADAIAVADARVIAALLPADFEAVARPTLQMMSQLEGGRGRVVRDVMLGNQVDYETIRGFDDFIRHESMGLRAPLDSKLHSRLCPLADHDLFVLRESMTLFLVGKYLDQPHPVGDAVLDRLNRAGIAGVWLTLFPQMEQLLAGADLEASPTPYRVGNLSIPWVPYESEWPQVSPAAFWIDHTRPLASLTQLEYGDVAEDDFDRSIVDGKLVVVGLDLDFVRSEARFRLPTQRPQVGNSVLMALAAQTLISDRVMRPLPSWAYLIPAVLLCLLTCWVVGLSSPRKAVLSAVAIPLAYLVAAMVGFRSCWFTEMAITPAALVLTAVVAGVTRYGYEIRWRNKMTDLFGRYVPRAVVSELISRRALEAIAVGGQRRNISVMFADIRGFTRFTENNDPELVLEQLNQFLGVMVDCTFEQDGTVDKFIGDAILVLFNAPMDQPDHAARAVRTADAIQKRLTALAADNPSSDLTIGIGIHTGEAIVGNVGTPQRLEYTAIGSTVNTSSRLCDRAGGGEVVVSEEVAQAAGSSFQWSRNEPMQLKGIERPMRTMTLIGRAEAANGSSSADRPAPDVRQS
jgi:adenylate cyclase